MDSIFPHLNASLNGLATVLLVVGLLLIKAKHEAAHKWTMLVCFGVSVVFLACYLYYHIVVKNGVSTKFPSYPPDGIRYAYYAMLLSHILLAMAVPVLAIMTIYYGLKDQRPSHLRWAKVTFPIWLYVSVTGVLVYLLLYQIYPPIIDKTTMQGTPPTVQTAF